VFKEGVVAGGKGVDSLPFDVLKIRVFEEEKKEGAIDAVEVLAHEEFSNDDAIEQLLPALLESELTDRF
jgi:hypothetical protein